MLFTLRRPPGVLFALVAVHCFAASAQAQRARVPTWRVTELAFAAAAAADRVGGPWS